MRSLPLAFALAALAAAAPAFAASPDTDVAPTLQITSSVGPKVAERSGRPASRGQQTQNPRPAQAPPAQAAPRPPTAAPPPARSGAASSRPARPAPQTRPAPQAHPATQAHPTQARPTQARPAPQTRPPAAAASQARHGQHPHTAPPAARPHPQPAPGGRVTTAAPAGQNIHRAVQTSRAHGDRRPAPTRGQVPVRRQYVAPGARGPHVVHVQPRGNPRAAPHARPHVVYYQHTYRHIRPYHGVFVYGPSPVYHHSYARQSGRVQVQQDQMPKRTIDRDNSLAVGIKGGSLIGGYDSANGFADPGLGVNVRYRPAESVGLEVGLMRFGMSSEDSARTNTVGTASVELFAWPWTRVSPYAIAGLTWDARNFDDLYYDHADDAVKRLATADSVVGPHVGLGMEFALGKSVALDLEGRYTGFLNADEGDPTLPGTLQTSVGAVVHF